MADDDLFLAVLRRRIKLRRLDCHLNQEDVAEAAGMVLRTYQRFEAYESKESFNPKIRNLIAIAEALSITVSALTQEPSKDEIQSLGEPLKERVWQDGKLV